MTYTRATETLFNEGSRQGKVCDLNISSYTTGGETIDAAGLGIDRDPKTVRATALGTTLRHFVWDRANKKLLAFDSAGAQVANATNLGACVRIEANY